MNREQTSLESKELQLFKLLESIISSREEVLIWKDHNGYINISHNKPPYTYGKGLTLEECLTDYYEESK